MKKKALYKDILKHIIKTKGRFIAIILLLFLGIFAYTGLQGSGRYMEDMIIQYYKTYNLADIVLQSTYGLESEDKEALESIDSMELIEFGYSQDVMLEKEINTKILSKTNEISNAEIIEGKIPEESGQIALDYDVFYKKYKIGEEIKIYNNEGEKEENLKLDTYKIVGFIRSPEYISEYSKGNSTIGEGSSEGFAIVLQEDFDMEIYTIARITLNNIPSEYNKEKYDEIVKQEVEKIEEALKDRPEIRLEKIKTEAYKEIQKAEDEIQDARNKLNNAKILLEEAKTEIDNGWKEYNQGQNKISEAEKELQKSKKLLDENQKLLNEYGEQIKEARAQLTSAHNELETNKRQIEEGLIIINENIIQIQQLIDLGIATPELITQLDILNSQKIELENNLTLINLGYEEYNIQKREFESKNSEYELGIKELEEASKTYNTAKTKIQKGKEELVKARSKLNTAEKEYKQAVEEYEKEKADAEIKISDGEKEIEETKKEIENLKKPVYLVNDRSYYPYYSMYMVDAEKVTDLANIFPVFLFGLAALVTLTTMARMIEEERGQIGTLKALGYDDFDIAKKFIIYGLISSFIASIVGVILGYEVLSKLVASIYIEGSTIQLGKITYYPEYIIISVVIALVCTLLVSMIVLKKTLKEKTAYLLRAKPPKSGSRIFLERIKIIWNSLGFNQKVTMRNLFRYKTRMLMTIVGIAGCVALLLAGFGLRDSISDIAVKQYEELFEYDSIAIINTSSKKQNIEEYKNYLDTNENIESYAEIYVDTIKAKATTGIEQDINIYAISNKEEFSKFIKFKDRKTNQEIYLQENGVIITEKLAKLLDAKVGDTITTYNNENEQFYFEIQKITESYSGHSIYMTTEYYEKILDKEIECNANFILLKDKDENRNNEMKAELLRNEAVISVQTINSMRKNIVDFADNLNLVVIILIICSSILAFVVLYTLNTINVAERERELSTIKVLGFYPKELTMYIYRESILLTILGIFAGFGLGKLLHYAMINIVAPDMVMLVPTLNISVFIYSTVITIAFSIIVMFVIHKKLKNINMIEALKSVE